MTWYRYLGVDLTPAETNTLYWAEAGGSLADIPDITWLQAEAAAIRERCHAIWRVRRRAELMG